MQTKKGAKMNELIKKRLIFIVSYFVVAIVFLYVARFFFQSFGYSEEFTNSFVNIATIIILVAYLLLRSFLMKRWLKM